MTQITVYSDHVWFEDFIEGEKLAFGRFEMTRENMLAYAELYDPEPFHTDEEEAKRLGWAGLIASGPQVVGTCRRMQKDGFPNAHVVISPGWDSIRWLKPVFPGDILSVRATVELTKPLGSRPTEGLVKMDCHIVRQRGETVSTMMTNWFVTRRPDGAGG
jgi:acyl dehydratase